VSNESLTERVGERTLGAMLLALTAVVLLGGVLALVADDEALPAAGARVHLEGVGTITRTDGSSNELRDGAVLRPGDAVEMEEGTAVLELAGGGTVEVRSGVGDVDDSRIVVGSPLRLQAGDALAEGPEGVAVEAAGTLLTLRGPSAARIRRELAVTTATYEGAVDVDSAGQARTVPAYRQLAVASVGRIPDDADPLDIDTADPWDQRFLGGAIALTRSLDSLSRTFTAQGARRTSAADFTAVLPILGDEDGFDSSLLDDARPDGETLVGGAIAALAPEGSFGRRWAEVFAFRDAGAEWGLVAFDQRVEEEPVLREVEAALSRSVTAPTGEVAAPPPPPTPTTAPTTSTPSTSAAPTTAGTTPTTAPTTTAAPPVTTIVPPIVPPLPTIPPVDPADPLPETGNGLLDGLLQPVSQLLGGLLGGG
jgi:hypothetical protein